MGLFVDLELMFGADFFVGSFSSQISRMVLERWAHTKPPNRTYAYKRGPQEQHQWRVKDAGVPLMAVSVDQGWYLSC